jgi:hypothetical protein
MYLSYPKKKDSERNSMALNINYLERFKEGNHREDLQDLENPH